MAEDVLPVEDLRELLASLADEVPDDVAAASWSRDGLYRWMADVEQAQDVADLAHAALALEKVVKRRAQPKWWKQERPIWVQGVLAITRSSQSIADSESSQLLHQLLLTLSKMLRVLDAGAGAGARKHVVDIDELILGQDSAEVVYADASVCDFFLQRKRQRLQAGAPQLPRSAVSELMQLARHPTREVLADTIVHSVTHGAPEAGSGASAWTRLAVSRVTVSHGGIGTLDPRRTERLHVACTPDSMRLGLDECLPEIPTYAIPAAGHRVLRALRQRAGAEMFEVPIEEAIISCPMPGYEARIRSRRLLDLGRVRRRLDAFDYGSLLEFRLDLKDLFQNAIDYHGPRGTGRGQVTLWIAQLAASLHAHTERDLARIVDELPPNHRSLSFAHCEPDAPWLAHDLVRSAGEVVGGPLDQLPAAKICEMRDACWNALEVLQREVSMRLRGVRAKAKVEAVADPEDNAAKLPATAGAAAAAQGGLVKPALANGNGVAASTV